MSDIDELTRAIWDDDIRAVKRLLKQRPERALEASPTCVTPLMHAAKCDYRSVRIVQALLDAGANAKARTSNNNTLLHWTVDANSPGCWGKAPGRIIKMLADAGAPLEERQHYFGWTPLMLAVCHGTTPELRGLLDVGCDPNALSTRTGCSVLSMTIADVKKTKLLLAHGADVHARDLHGQTALEVAHQVLEESRDSPDFCREVLQSVRVLKKAAAST